MTSPRRRSLEGSRDDRLRKRGHLAEWVVRRRHFDGPLRQEDRPGHTDGMGSTRLCRCSAITAFLFVAACGGGDDSSAPAENVGDATETTVDATGADDGDDSSLESETSSAPDTSESTEPAADASGQACALLDESFLNETFAGQTGTFGDPFQFQSGSPSPDGFTCTWNDGSTGLSLRMTLEDAATAETDNHSGRAYNIDVEPIVEPQDGPGEKAVLLVDSAFGDLGGDGFPYGYFFVQGDVAVFVETVGLDLGPDGLRKLADEASARLTAS